MPLPFFSSFEKNRDQVMVIDLGAKVTKAVHLSRKGDGFALNSYALVDAPVFEKGLNIAPMADHLKAVAQLLNSRLKPVSLAVGVDSSLLRHADMPMVTAHDMRQMLKFSSKNYLQQDLSDCVFDVHVMVGKAESAPKADAPKGGNPKMRVLVGAAKKQIIADLQEAAEQAGLEADQIIPSFIGPANAFEMAHPEPFAKEVVALVDVGFKNTTICILYNTLAQDVITFSQAHDTLFLSSGGRVVVGAFGFIVPTNATVGQTYSIALHRPSATSDGIKDDVFISAPTNGTVSALKTLTIGSPAYLVGDAAPFRWFNAPDFGDTNLLANDIAQVFQSAVYGLNRPPVGSDMLDAMDSCCGVGTNDAPTSLFRYSAQYGGSITIGTDFGINSIAFGDGVLNVADIFVTFRRSLDASLTNFVRFRSNGIHYATTTSNSFRGVAGQSLTRSGGGSRGNLVAKDLSAPAEPSSVTFSAGEIIGTAGQTLNVPITARVSGTLPLRVLMLNLNVVPLAGSPPLAARVQFVPDASLGAPGMSQSRGLGNYSAAWLNDSVAGLSGDAVVGTLVITLPAGAGADAAYVVRFDHASASPAGIGTVPARVEGGLVTTRMRNTSSWSDAIPDAWRLRHFGALNNLLSAANADADGDGIPNWAEFRAGTDPTDSGSGLQLRAPGLVSGGPRLRWPTAVGKTYVIEVSTALVSPNWVAIATGIVGNGRDIDFQTPPPGGPRFYRVRLVEP